MADVWGKMEVLSPVYATWNFGVGSCYINMIAFQHVLTITFDDIFFILVAPYHYGIITVNIGSSNGLMPVWYQAVTCTNADKF